MVIGFRFAALKICFCHYEQMIDSLRRANWEEGEKPVKIGV
jgi:hypothetical protein